MTDNRKGDILVVDDTPASLRLLTELLRAEGYRVRPAINGELALQAAANSPPELMLLDINMPGMNGFEVCKHIRMRPETRDTPIIFVSALQETVDKVKGFELGAVDYVTKPYQREELLARVHTHLELHRLRCHFEKVVRIRTSELCVKELALARSNRKLRSISRCNKIIVRSTDEQMLLEGICNAICEEAGYHAAGVGYIESGAKGTINPVAWAGVEEGVVTAPGAAWANSDMENGPLVRAIRQGEPSCRSCVCIPLKDEDANIFGVLSVYSSEPDIFTPDEIHLLEELAADMAFGVKILRISNERDQAGAEIRALNQYLEQRIAERTAALELANQELESFSYSVSHDLRAPLRAIQGFSHILLDECAANLSEDGRRYAETISHNAERMNQLISDILDFSRMSRREVMMELVDMNALALAIFEDLRSTASAERSITLHMGNLPPAYGDRAMIRQVLINVISNAIKYTAPRAQAVIEVNGATSNKEIVHGPSQKSVAANIYWVKDNGVGFDMRFADRIFSAFQRLHGEGEFEGTGIGLTIVKRIVSRHGGEVWVESKLNEGTTLYFSLPANGKKRNMGGEIG